MKTEPTEACKMIEESWYAIPYMGVDYPQDPDIVVDKEDVYEIAKKAFQEGQSSPKIKQLEWTDHLRHYFVDTPFGVYLILRNHKFEENESWTLYFNSYVIDGCIDSDKAQEVAQADFEKRIKECLE